MTDDLSPPLPPPAPQPRVFIVKVTSPDDPGSVTGYAITQQVGFIDMAAPSYTPDLAEQSEAFRESIETLFSKLENKTYLAIGVPGESDSLGGGYRMLASASRGTSTNPH